MRAKPHSVIDSTLANAVINLFDLFLKKVQTCTTPVNMELFFFWFFKISVAWFNVEFVSMGALSTSHHLD